MHRLLAVTVFLFSYGLVKAETTYLDYWSDDVIYQAGKPVEAQLKRHRFVHSDRISIRINNKKTNNIIAIENRAVIEVTLEFDLPGVEKVELVDILKESVGGLLEEGTPLPTRLAQYRIGPEAEVNEITGRFRDISIIHLQGFAYSEMVLMVKVRTRDGKHYYKVERIRVHI